MQKTPPPVQLQTIPHQTNRWNEVVPSPETLQAALDTLFSEVSLLSSCATDTKETVPILKEKEECKPSTVIPQYYSYYAAEVSYQYYGIV